jgi:hypothetical protein
MTKRAMVMCPIPPGCAKEMSKHNLELLVEVARLLKPLLGELPLDEKILGFSNCWYKPAMDSALVHELEPHLRLRIVTVIYFCATKPAAVAGRGKFDYQASHDLEELIDVSDRLP